VVVGGGGVRGECGAGVAYLFFSLRRVCHAGLLLLTQLALFTSRLVSFGVTPTSQRVNPWLFVCPSG